MITYDSAVSWGVLIWGGDGGQKIVGLKIDVDGCLWLVSALVQLNDKIAVPQLARRGHITLETPLPSTYAPHLMGCQSEFTERSQHQQRSVQKQCRLYGDHAFQLQHPLRLRPERLRLEGKPSPGRMRTSVIV